MNCPGLDGAFVVHGDALKKGCSHVHDGHVYQLLAVLIDSD
jgi:hypothetical protein